MDSCELERMAALLESSGGYRILRRLEQPSVYNVPDGTPTRRAVFLDIETTRLDPAADKIVGIAIGRFRDPGRQISPSSPLSCRRSRLPDDFSRAQMCKGFVVP
jgi:hypothetical protein